MRFWTNALAVSLAFGFGIMPLRLRWAVGAMLGWLWFDVLKIRRFTILKNLTIAFPEKSKEERLRLAQASMKNVCYNFIEVCLMAKLDQKWLEKQTCFHGMENYEKALNEGKGILMLSLHLGNGDLGIAAMGLKGIPLNVISKKFKNKFLNQFWFGVREKKGTKFLEAHGRSLPFEILKACKQKQSVVFVIDQFMGKPYGIETRFFGRKTGSAYGLSLFALKTEAPVLPVYTYRDAELKAHVVFEPAVPFEKIEDRDLQIAHMTQRYNDEVEKIVRKYPEQWMWVHRRWKKWE